MSTAKTYKAYEHAYEKFVDKGSFYFDHHTGSRQEFSYLGLGIAGEAGECADAIKKMVREPIFNLGLKDHIVKTIYEAGDNLWYITRICQAAGITLADLRIMNTVKLYERLRFNGQEELAIWPYYDLSYTVAKEYVESLTHRLNNIGGEQHEQ